MATERQPARLGLGIAMALFGAALVSWLRFRLGGTLNIRHLEPFQDLVLGLAFAAAFASAAGLYLLALRRADGAVTWPLLAVAMLVHVGASVALPLTSNDAFPNLAYGRLMVLGHDPAVSCAADLGADDPFGRLVDAHWRNTTSVYGPILNRISAACARAGTVTSAFLRFKLAMLATGLSILLLAYGFCRSLENRGAWTFCLIGLNPLLAWEVSGQAHNDGVMVLAAMAFVWAVHAKREWLALLLLTVGFVTKLGVAPLLLLFLCWELRRSVPRGAAMTAVALGIVVGLYAPAWKGVSTLAGPRFAALPSTHHVVNSLGGLPLDAARHFLPAAFGPAFLIWTTATGLFLAALGLRYAWRATTLEAVFRDALVFTLLYECLGMLWYQPWYATWLLPLAVGGRDRRLSAIVALYTVLVPLLYHPTELYGLAALGSHGLALVLLLGDYAPALEPGR